MAVDKVEKRKERIVKLDRKLKELFPDADRGTVLRYTNPWELTVAVILSAQCTDKKVNEVTEKLFKKYTTLDDYVNADQEEFAQDIKPTGFYKNKAKSILGAAKMVQKEFGGTIPKTMEELTKLPGVARKTANVVLGNAFGVVEGIAVDTHVKRFAQRFDLTDHDDPDKIEQDLMELLPKGEWFAFTYRAIAYGRSFGSSRGYDPDKDPLAEIHNPKET